MAPPFSINFTDSQLNDFALATLRKLDRESPTDLVTPKHPLFRRLQNGQDGGFHTEIPGRGPVRDVYYATPERTVHMSQSAQVVDRNQTPHESHTQAQYRWNLMLSTLTMTLYERKNTMGKAAIVDFLRRKKDGVDKNHRNVQVDILWNGKVTGTDAVFGLNDAIRFDPTSNPSKGSVGGISVSDSVIGTLWRNKTANYNTAFQVFSTGAETTTFLDNGTKSLLALYHDCGYYSGEEDYPDLIPCNEAYYRCCFKLVRENIMFRDDNAKKELGVEGVAFQNATIFVDRNIANDPNNSAYGVAYLLNSDDIKVTYAEGIRGDWGEGTDHEKQTSMSWDKTTQMTITYGALNRHGVHYGVIPTVSAS